VAQAVIGVVEPVAEVGQPRDVILRRNEFAARVALKHTAEQEAALIDR